MQTYSNNYAIKTLEDQLTRTQNALKGWSEESKRNYSEQYKQAIKRVYQLTDAIEKLEGES